MIGLGNELNGLSLGGIGRETDIHHVEIMNNVDDGIEIWGGTVNLKYFSIWNIGDDSFDVDQGWRGKAQFGLIVQGYSVDASQGSGVGDNCFETDGAEDSDCAAGHDRDDLQLHRASASRSDGDGGTAWRDNARVQYRNCIFMDCGEQARRASTTSTATARRATASTARCPGRRPGPRTTPRPRRSTRPARIPTPDVLYQAQTSGKLAEITDSVFYNNNARQRLHRGERPRRVRRRQQQRHGAGGQPDRLRDPRGADAVARLRPRHGAR